MSSPGSMTMASWVASSPMTEQLHCRGPTGKILWIMRAAGQDYLGFSGCGSGAGFWFAGGSGFVCCVVVLEEPRTELGPRRREAYTESVIEVSIKITADQVVALDKRLAVPRGPKAVWLPMPPNAAAMSALVPLCSNTTITINRQTAM